MEVAQSLTQEKSIYASRSASSLSISPQDVHSSSNVYHGRVCDGSAEASKETSLVLDAAVTLCKIAAKKVFPLYYKYTIAVNADIHPSLFVILHHYPMKANHITRDDYSVLPSLSLSDHCSSKDSNNNNNIALPAHLSFPIASFGLSRDLLRSSVACCPSVHLGPSLDLLQGAETVLSVYERVEEASQDRSSGSHASVGGVLADGVFAR